MTGYDPSMTDRQAGTAPTSPTAGTRRRWLCVLTIIVVVLVILAVAAGVWYVLFRPAGPPPIGPGAPTIPSAVLRLL
jgi:hypothetical protein